MSDLEAFRQPNGAGSRVRCPTAWIRYDDGEYTQGSQQTLAAATRTAFTCDGLGGGTITTFGGNLARCFDGTAIHPNASGQVMHLRIGCKVTPANANSYMVLQLDIGVPGTSEINIVSRTISFPRGAGIEHPISVAFPIYCLETFRANGGRFYVTMSAGDTATIYSRDLFLVEG